MSLGASATFDRPSAVLLRYLDVVLVVLVAVPALALGVPALGYAVGGAAWVVQRLAAAAGERRLAEMDDVHRRIGFGVASSMLRVWMLAGAIVVVGVAGERADGLTAALVIFCAFSLYFVRSVFARLAQGGDTSR